MTTPPITDEINRAGDQLLTGSSPAAPVEPNWDVLPHLSTVSDANIDLCWTCSACDNGCPVSLATGRLRPQRNVRMAVYGMLDELLSSNDIWYCLSCRRCLQGCPNRVKPFELHKYLQNQALDRGILSAEFPGAYRKLFAEFQRVRWRTVAHCFKDVLTQLPDQTWYHWLKTPLRQATYRPVNLNLKPTASAQPKTKALLDGQACFTCSECSGCCPIICDGDVFDPKKIIRMANLGLFDELLRSPAIWLCLGCQQCAEACSQTVSGYEIIRQLQQQAIEKGFVNPVFPSRLLDADRIIYPKFINEIDTLIGLYRVSGVDRR